MKTKSKTKTPVKDKTVKLPPQSPDEPGYGADYCKYLKSYGYPDVFIDNHIRKLHNDGIARRNRIEQERKEQVHIAELRKRAAEREAQQNGTTNPTTPTGGQSKPVRANVPVPGSGGDGVVPVRSENGRFYIFDKPATSIIRWMGYEAWTLDDCRTALKALGLNEIKDNTLKAQTMSGRKGDAGPHGPVPDLSKDQGEALYAMIEPPKTETKSEPKTKTEKKSKKVTPKKKRK